MAHDSATSLVRDFNNRKTLGGWYGGEVPSRIEEKDMTNAGIAKYNLQVVLRGSVLLLVAPDQTIIRVLHFAIGTPIERAKLNIASIEAMINPAKSHVAKSVENPRYWAIWKNGVEWCDYPTKTLAQLSCDDELEFARLLRELLGLPEAPVAA